jgi:hypothetical protein
MKFKIFMELRLKRQRTAIRGTRLEPARCVRTVALAAQSGAAMPNDFILR